MLRQWQKIKGLAQFLTIAVLGGLIVLALPQPGRATDSLTLRFGPFEQVVAVSEIETYAKTGQISPSLQFFSGALKPEIRKALTTKLALDPMVASQVVGDLLKSPSGQQLLSNLQIAVPGLSADLLQSGITIAAKQVKALDAISILKAMPQKNLTIDISQAIAVGSKLNVNFWKTQAVSTVLRRSLAVDATSFKAPFDPAAEGSAKVEKTTIELTDKPRNRTMLVDLYWSSSPQGPLVVLEPGFEANRGFLAYLGKHLASHGFSVALIEHPSTLQNTRLKNIDLEKLLPGTEFIDRPKDLSFMLDELAKLNNSNDFKGKFDTTRVSVIGHSLGGYVALAAAGGEANLDELRNFCRTSTVIQRVPADWLQCSAANLSDRVLRLKDKRIIQVMALNPVAGQIFGKTGLSQVTVPTLMLTSTEDTLTPSLDQQLLPFMQLPAPKYLMTAIGATHLSVIDPSLGHRSVASGRTLVPERQGPEMDPLRMAMKGVTLAFVQQTTSQGPKYLPFLSSGAYVQSVASPAVSLRLNRELPGSLTRLLQMVGPV